MKGWLSQLLFDWVFILLYRLFQGFLCLVDLMESFFDIFAGTAKVFYKGNSDFLISIFFGHDAVTNAFWAMALIAIALAFGFCIVQLARKTTDVTGSVKQTVGQIVSNFLRCLLIIVMLNAVTVAAINISNVMLDRINFALENASILDQEDTDKHFNDQEYATMTKILATVANYSVNPSADSRYNVNSCFNAVRTDLLSLHVNGFFEFDYPLDSNGHYTWQGALALLASSADLTTDLNLDTYYADVVNAFQIVTKELNSYTDFAPVQQASISTDVALDTDTLIFLIAGMEAAQNSLYNSGSIDDTIRRGYISGDKDYNDLSQVRKDFDIWEMDYMVGYIACIVFVIIMAICIFTFIVRLFNLLLLYLSAPLFASAMPADDGSKWNSWIQAFVIQLFSGFGMVIAMRLYLIIIPLVISDDLVFFPGSPFLNRMAQLLMILGGSWAVLQAGNVITGILAGNPGMAAIQQEGRIASMTSGAIMAAPGAALRAGSSLIGGIASVGKAISNAPEKSAQKASQKATALDRKATQRQNKADALQAKLDQQQASGSSASSIGRTMSKLTSTQRKADKLSSKAHSVRAKAGLERSYPGGYHANGGSTGSSPSPSQEKPPAPPPNIPPRSDRVQPTPDHTAAESTHTSIPQKKWTPPSQPQSNVPTVDGKPINLTPPPRFGVDRTKDPAGAQPASTPGGRTTPPPVPPRFRREVPTVDGKPINLTPPPRFGADNSDDK